MQGGQGQDWGYLVPMDRLDERYDRVKGLESPRKSWVRRKGGQRGGSARVGDQCLSDPGQWSHYLPSVGGNHLGNNSIYKPKKVFGLKNQITGKTSSRMASAKVWEVSFSDLGQPGHFQLNVEGDLVR